MTYKDILKLPEGTHVVTINTERCMVIRMKEGFTLTTFLPNKNMLIQRYSEKAALLCEDRFDNIFAADAKEEEHESTDC